METKILEIRDVATKIEVVAMKFEPDNEAEHDLVQDAGYGEGDYQLRYTLVGKLHDGKLLSDPYKQPGKTLRVAHQMIQENFYELESGDVVDVERGG